MQRDREIHAILCGAKEKKRSFKVVENVVHNLSCDMRKPVSDTNWSVHSQKKVSSLKICIKVAEELY